jgi:hypothetical protein
LAGMQAVEDERTGTALNGGFALLISYIQVRSG